MERAAVCVLLSKPLSLSFSVSEAAVLQCGVSKKYIKRKESIKTMRKRLLLTITAVCFLLYAVKEVCNWFAIKGVP